MTKPALKGWVIRPALSARTMRMRMMDRDDVSFIDSRKSAAVDDGRDSIQIKYWRELFYRNK